MKCRPTFYRVCRKKSTEGFSCLPYVVALFSATLWIYYALLKPNAYLLITINTVGCIIETAYLLLEAGSVCEPGRVRFGAGADSVSDARLPASASSRLDLHRLVIRTKSVEFMPFWLSFFLTISAVVWFGYGLLIKDFYVAVIDAKYLFINLVYLATYVYISCSIDQLPNVLGFIFGILQMLLYIAYKGRKEGKSNDNTLPIAEKSNDGSTLPEMVNKDSQLSQPEGDEEKVAIQALNNLVV
ncbi:hypothetical protein ZIOFF_020481 [Zingiber officinale]|uniref:Bidirectional sugar transporter SWEET n=1 Tax=Zingiber officinale TaxID=94328 RepID=A0A8J5HIF9_ZINOF|nr:hypothetical protein ZIOFF_020481 [Zingiber officinale]